MSTHSARAIPRPYKLHWESGQIVEEASYRGEFHESCLQLLQSDEGTVRIRFCYYNLEGRYQRGPLMIDEKHIEGLRAALSDQPELKSLLRKLAQ